MITKYRFAAFLGCAVMASMMLGAISTGAQTVEFGDPTNPTKATAINDLQVGNEQFDIVFQLARFAFEIYGDFPGQFSYIDDAIKAEDFVDAVNAALLDANAVSIGEEGVPDAESDGYTIGFESFILPIGDVESVRTWRALNEGTSDWASGGLNPLTYNLDERNWAVIMTATPDHQSTWGSVKSLFR